MEKRKQSTVKGLAVIALLAAFICFAAGCEKAEQPDSLQNVTGSEMITHLTAVADGMEMGILSAVGDGNITTVCFYLEDLTEERLDFPFQDRNVGMEYRMLSGTQRGSVDFIRYDRKDGRLILAAEFGSHELKEEEYFEVGNLYKMETVNARIKEEDIYSWVQQPGVSAFTEYDGGSGWMAVRRDGIYSGDWEERLSDLEEQRYSVILPEGGMGLSSEETPDHEIDNIGFDGQWLHIRALVDKYAIPWGDGSYYFLGTADGEDLGYPSFYVPVAPGVVEYIIEVESEEALKDAYLWGSLSQTVDIAAGPWSLDFSVDELNQIEKDCDVLLKDGPRITKVIVTKAGVNVHAVGTENFQSSDLKLEMKDGSTRRGFIRGRSRGIGEDDSDEYYRYSHHYLSEWLDPYEVTAVTFGDVRISLED